MDADALKIDLISPSHSRYHVLHTFTHLFHQALKRAGIRSRLYPSPTSKHLPHLVSSLIEHPPDCTLSFNGLLPDSQGVFLSDTLHIPHMACLVDSPNHFLPLTKSDYTIIGCIDQSFCDFFRDIPFDRVLFFPHAAAQEMATDPSHQRDYDVVMMASCLDHESIWKKWKKNYSPHLRRLLEEAADKVLSDTTTTFLQASVEFMKDPQVRQELVDKDISFIVLLDQLEDYIRDKDRISLLQSITDVRVHLFGSKTGWLKYFPKRNPNIMLEGAISFQQDLEILKRSKISLNSMPNYKYGAHERIFTSLACGSLPVTNHNVFMDSQFKENEDILFFAPKRWDSVNEKLNFYLSHEEERCHLVANGQAKVMEKHTWDQRVQFLKESLPSLLQSIRGY